MGFSLSASAAASSASGSAIPPSAVGWSSQKVAKTLASRLGKKTNEFETTSSGVIPLSQGSLLGSSKPMYHGQLCAGPLRRGTLQHAQTPVVSGDCRSAGRPQHTQGLPGSGTARRQAPTGASEAKPRSLTQQQRDPRYLGGRIQFEGRLLSHTAEVGPNLLFVTFVVRVIQVVVVS